MLYLDSAATRPVRREALEAMWPALTENFGNPSSQHELGERAALTLDSARREVASSLAVRSHEIAFTAGGTEAANLAIKGIALGKPAGRHLITTAIEHEAVLACADYLQRLHGFEVTYLVPGRDGRIDPATLAAALRTDTTLVSIGYANNEIGTIQDLSALSAITGAHGVPLHTDAVQAAGWLPLEVGALGVDALTLSGHKVGAPKGIGAAYLRGRLAIEPVLHGGGQEGGRRSGTENVAGAAALATALRLAQDERALLTAPMVARREKFIAAVLADVPGAMLTGHREHRLAGHASFCFPGTSGEAILLELERRGIWCSSGSACAAGHDEPSHVLLACSVDAAVAQTAVRMTFGPEVSDADLARVVAALAESVQAVSAVA